MLCHASKKMTRPPRDIAGLERNLGCTVNNEANSSNQDEEQNPKLHKVGENHDYTIESSQKSKIVAKTGQREQVMLPHRRKLIS